MHGCNGLRDVLPNVYIHLRRTQLCLSDNTRQNGQFNIILCVFLRSCDAKEYSRAVRRVFCESMLQCLRSENQTELSSLSRSQIYPYACSSLTPTYWHFFTFYAPCSKCILAYVPPVHMFSSNLRRSRFILNKSLPKSPSPPLTFSARFYSLTKISIDLRHHFCLSKKVFVRYCLIIVSEKMSLTKIIHQRN